MKYSEQFPERKRLPFDKRLDIGKQFEVEASHFLTSVGFPIGLNFSAQGQWEFGESSAHCEIKKDQNFRRTGNLFIETRERRDDTGLSKWRDAGIYDASKPWFYLIGDKTIIWLLGVRSLKLQHKSGEHRFVSLPTSEGFLLPVPKANELCIKWWQNWGQTDQDIA